MPNHPHIQAHEDLVLRCLRLKSHQAFSCNTILSCIKALPDEPPFLRLKDIITCCRSLMDKSLIFQANYDFYAITNEGKQYINAKYPLFVVKELHNDNNNESA